jgi:hypothetical protein
MQIELCFHLHESITQNVEDKEMKANCTSCGYEVSLDHTVFMDYVGPVKCFCCGAMIEVKIAAGFLYSINPLAILDSRAISHPSDNPKGLSG